MIEIIYKEDQKQAEGNEKFFRIPNNIRQIGEIKGQQKIYIEDYAYTFLKKISRMPEEGGKAAILLGQYHWAEGSAYIFVKSALQIRDMEVSPEHIVFNDKVLFVTEPGEWEEAFFVYENNQLNRQPGYYIYYEKNEPMQAYMIEMSQNKSIEETEKVPDRAVLDFRRAIKQNQEKQESQKNRKKETETVKENKRNGRMIWTLGGCTAAAALAVGITFFNSYQNMSETLGVLTPNQQVTQQEEEEGTAKETSVQVSESTKTNDKPLISMQDMTPGEQADSENTSETGENTDVEAGDETGVKEAASSGTETADTETTGTETTNTGTEDTTESVTEEAQTISQAAGGSEYVIKKGDTLTSISKQYYGTIEKVQEICRLNGMSPEDIIYAGQKILLPPS